MEIFSFLILALFGGLLGLIAFIYSFKKGLFEDLEDPKYQMFREEEEDA